MALNFMGLGFSFGAKDDGLKDTLGDTKAGFDDISKSTGAANKISSAFTGTIAALGASLSAMKLGEISNKMDDLTQKITGSAEASDGAAIKFETFFKQMELDLPQVTSNQLEDMTKRMSDFGISQDESASLMKQLKDTGVPFKDWGVMLDIAGTKMQLLGGDASGLIGSMASLDRGYFRNIESTNDFAKNLVGLGKHLGITEAAFEGIPKVIEGFDKQLSVLPFLQNEKSMNQLAQSALGMAKVLQVELGVNAVAAMDESVSAMNKLLDMRANAERLKSGFENEFSGMTNQLLSFGFSVNDIMAAAEKGPLEFMNLVNDMGESLGTDSALFKNVQNVLRGELGDSFTFLAGSMGKTGDIVNKAIDDISKGVLPLEGAMGDISKSISDTLSNLDKQLDTSREEMQRTIGAMSLNARKELTGNMIDAVDSVGNKLEILSEKFPKLAESIALFRTKGMMGLMMTVKPLRDALSMLGMTGEEDLLPILGVAGSLAMGLKIVIPLFAGITSFVMIALGGIAALVGAFKLGGGEFEVMIDKFKESDSVLEGIGKTSEYAFNSIFDGLKIALMNATNFIEGGGLNQIIKSIANMTEIVINSLPDIMNKALTSVADFGVQIADLFIVLIKSIDWGGAMNWMMSTMSDIFSNTLPKMFESLVVQLEKWFKKLPELGKTLGAAIGKMLASFIKNLPKMIISLVFGLIKLIPSALSMIGVALVAISDFIFEFVVGIFDGMGLGFIGDFMRTIGGMLGDLVDIIFWPFETAFGFIRDLFTVGPMQALSNLWVAFESFADSLFSYLVAPFELAWKWIGDIFGFEAGENIINSLLDGVMAAWESGKEFFSDMADYIVGWWPFSKPKNPESPLANLNLAGQNVISELVNGLETKLPKIEATIKAGVDIIPNAIVKDIGLPNVATNKMESPVKEITKLIYTKENNVNYHNDMSGSLKNLNAPVSNDSGMVSAINISNSQIASAISQLAMSMKNNNKDTMVRIKVDDGEFSRAIRATTSKDLNTMGNNLGF